MKTPPDNLRPLPPKWPDRFLEWFCAPDLLEEVQGDIHELFLYRVRTQGLKTAPKVLSLGCDSIFQLVHNKGQ